MPYKHGIKHGLSSRWADKNQVGVLQSDITVYKVETPNYDAVSEGSYVARAM